MYETKRQVRNDYTITLSGEYIQLEKSDVLLPIARQFVVIRKYFDESLHIFNSENQPIKFTLLNSKPKKKIKIIRKAPKDHPWRKIKFGKARYA